MKSVKVVLYGVGPIGSGIVGLLSRKPWAKIVGAIDTDEKKVGKDLGEVAGLGHSVGVLVSGGAREVLEETSPDIVVHATSSYLPNTHTQILECVNAKADVVSTSEELSYPYGKYPELARKIDENAKAQGATVLGTGVNPGFVMDTLAVAMSGVCQTVESVAAERIVDTSKRRWQLQRKTGAGLSVEEFQRLVREGKIKHVGLPESTMMIGAALGWKLEDVQEEITPVVAEQRIQTSYVDVAKASVAGVRQVARGVSAGRQRVVLNLMMYVGAKDPRDSIRIEGVPPIDLTIRGGVQGDQATAAIIVNSIPNVVAASPGLKTMIDLPIVHATE
jgi:4-hydroxy-tetrahydrodipicolinate reductase